MDSEHPYRPPQAALDGPTSTIAEGGGEVPHAVVESLRRTRPWVLFIGVVVLIGCALMVLLALAMMLLGGIAGVGDSFGIGGPIGGLLLGGIYLVFAALYVIPGVHLLRYSSAIKRFGPEPTAESVAGALRHQYAFWRFVGIVTIAVIALYALLIVIGVIVGIAGAMG